MLVKFRFGFVSFFEWGVILKDVGEVLLDMGNYFGSWWCFLEGDWYVCYDVEEDWIEEVVE